MSKINPNQIGFLPAGFLIYGSNDPCKVTVAKPLLLRLLLTDSLDFILTNDLDYVTFE